MRDHPIAFDDVLQVLTGHAAAADAAPQWPEASWQALCAANTGYAPSYGADRWTERRPAAE